MTLVGFIASAPELHLTKAGAECCRIRVGVEQWRKEADGSFTRRDPTFHDMVAFESDPGVRAILRGADEGPPGCRGEPSSVVLSSLR